jgi:protein-arginine kinase activator protein McsA
MKCERCGADDASLQVKVMQDGEPVELVLCAVCVMVEAHRNVMALPPAIDDGGEEQPLT